MQLVEVALVRKGSEDLIVALFPANFRLLKSTDRRLCIFGVKEAVRTSNLQGSLISIWEGDRGQTIVDAPSDLLSFCSLLSVRWVRKNLCLRLQIA
jgi:hypothetical protein